MKDTTRQELLEIITEFGFYCPDWRLGQMIAVFAMHARADSPQAIWDAEDDELLAAARKQLQYFRETRPVPEQLLAAPQS